MLTKIKCFKQMPFMIFKGLGFGSLVLQDNNTKEQISRLEKGGFFIWRRLTADVCFGLILGLISTA